MQTDIPHGAYESPAIRVEPEWIDANGHMNVAFYLRVFDLAGDAIFDKIGLGWSYVQEGKGMTFALENRIRFVREVFAGNPLVVKGFILDLSEKLIHFTWQMYQAEKGYLAAASESISAHIDIQTRKTAPFPPALFARLQAIREAQRHLPRTEGFERPIGIRRRTD